MITPDADRNFFRGWFVALALGFCFCVALNLNGSSVGMWRNLLKEPGIARGLLFSSPKQVRVDEWSVWTPSMLSQARQVPPFPIENPSLGAGRAPLLMSVPVAYYTTWFRPQLWGFFIFNFERGFSFYWCAKVFGLFAAMIFLLRELGVRHRWTIIFGATWVFFSSYVQWWFSSPAMLPEMLASWAVCVACVLRLRKDRHLLATALSLGGFVFCGINFVLCLYPPYQIPLLLVGLAIVVGFCFEQEGRPCGQVALLSLGAISAIAALLIPFWFDVRSTLEIVVHTAYPGARRSSGGELSIFKLFSGVIGFFEIEQIHPRIYDNIAEASNFYPLWPAAALVAAIAHARNGQRLQPLVIALGAAVIVLSLYCLLPMPHWFLNVSLLCFAAERRTLLAIGMANIIFCVLFFDRYRAPVLGKNDGAIAAVVCWLGVAGLLWLVHRSDSTFFRDPLQLAIPIAINTGLVTLFFWQPLRRWMPLALTALLILSTAGINPLMRGLSPLTQSPAFSAIERIHRNDPNGKWLGFHTRYFAQLIKATGANTFNGTKVTPDLPLLHQLVDPTGEYESIYNRYANIACELPRHDAQIDRALVYPDFYMLFFPPDLPVLRDSGYRYVVFPQQWTTAARYGFSLLEHTARGDLWIYRRDAAIATGE